MLLIFELATLSSFFFCMRNIFTALFGSKLCIHLDFFQGEEVSNVFNEDDVFKVFNLSDFFGGYMKRILLIIT